MNEPEKDAMRTLEGRTLGKYRIQEPLGRGGMARVYRAYHPQLERYVAVKVVRADLGDDETFLARFRREAQAVAALRHPNIVQVFDFDVEGDLTYMVMELLEGDALKTRLNDYRTRGERMAWGEMARILLDVLNGLGYAHAQGMIHRDIKPGNVLLTRSGDAVIADFGIAQIVGGTRHTARGALMGTPEYMAPEQGLENQSDARSDLYSLGVIFYEMLTLQPPFIADTPLAVLMQHLNAPLPPPSNAAPDVPEPFEQIALKALAKDPDDRYQTAPEMTTALRQAVEALEIVLPATLPPPLSFTTDEAPSESVAVLSGAVREHLTDAAFAADDTDATLGQRLDAERATSTKLPGQAILTALLFTFFGNLFLLTLGGVTGSWGALEQSWPIELWLVGAALALIMAQLDNIWLLIPTLLLQGNALLMSYSALTGKWNQWSFLWLLEVWIVSLAILVPIQLAKRPGSAREMAHRLGRLLAATGAILALVVAALGVTLHMVDHWIGGR